MPGYRHSATVRYPVRFGRLTSVSLALGTTEKLDENDRVAQDGWLSIQVCEPRVEGRELTRFVLDGGPERRVHDRA